MILATATIKASFSPSIYNAIIGQDRSIDQVCKLINVPRTKKEAKMFVDADLEENPYVDIVSLVKKEGFVVETNTMEIETTGYLFVNEDERYPGVPAFELITIDGSHIKINDLVIEPIELKHFTLKSYGFRIGNFAYVTDLSELSEEAFQKLIGVEYLIIEALRKKEHYSHINLSQAIDIAQRLNVKKVWFTHVSHEMGKAADVNPTLPENMMLAYDGLEIEI